MENSLRILPCLDSEQMAGSRCQELNIPRDVAAALGQSAVEVARDQERDQHGDRGRDARLQDRPSRRLESDEEAADGKGEEVEHRREYYLPPAQFDILGAGDAFKLRSKKKPQDQAGDQIKHDHHDHADTDPLPVQGSGHFLLLLVTLRDVPCLPRKSTVSNLAARPTRLRNEATALRSRQGFQRGQLTELENAGFESWAKESFEIATKIVYRNGLIGSPKGDNRDRRDVQAAPVLPLGYVVNASRIADRRLILAGYRLADLLTRIIQL